jgi:glycine/D-amino acid oxidase-like deaminating enzyme
VNETVQLHHSSTPQVQVLFAEVLIPKCGSCVDFVRLKCTLNVTRRQVAQLRQLQMAAASNGVTDLQLLSSAEAVALEPALRCTGALLSPSTGILDTHE